MPYMKARRAGPCQNCVAPIRKGDRIWYDGRACHEYCRPSGNAKDDSDYAAGIADGHAYSENRKAYGWEFAERMEMDAELARYNSGEDY